MPTKIATECTAQELRSFAELVMGLDIPAKCNAPTILNKIREGGVEALSLDIPDAAGERTADVKKIQASPEIEAAADDEMVAAVILIPVKPGKGGDRPCEVSHNGSVMFIPRGQKCVVPIKYVHVLELAKRNVPIVDGNSQIIGWREAHTEPHSVLQRMTKAELVLFDEQNDSRIVA